MSPQRDLVRSRSLVAAHQHELSLALEDQDPVNFRLLKRRFVYCTRGCRSNRGNDEQYVNNAPRSHEAAIVARTASRASGSTGTPSRKATYRPEIDGTRSPGTTIPTKFKGPAADTVIVSPF